jgi:hypothetical protein
MQCPDTRDIEIKSRASGNRSSLGPLVCDAGQRDERFRVAAAFFPARDRAAALLA